MSAIGIDIGGTKIETRVFDTQWRELRRQRVDTPSDYDVLVQVITAQIAWADQPGAPVGVGSAGLINPKTGLLKAANLVANRHPFPHDIAKAAGRPIHFVNDARALGLSEAVFGAGKDHATVAALILGTGIGGAVVVDGTLRKGPTMTGGEVGHTAAPAAVVMRHDLPLLGCGCGRTGCIEAYVSGTGLTQLAAHFTGSQLSATRVAAGRHGATAKIWAIWLELLADLIVRLTLTVDPDVIVLGGGLSGVDGLTAELTRAAKAQQLGGFDVPKIVLAQGGDASGARGAAYAAWQEQGHA